MSGKIISGMSQKKQYIYGKSSVYEYLTLYEMIHILKGCNFVKTEDSNKYY